MKPIFSERTTTATLPTRSHSQARFGSVLAVAFISLMVGVSCTMSPTKKEAPPPVNANAAGDAMRTMLESGYQAYERRDFTAASKAYQEAYESSAADANTRQLAYLGDALIRLSTDRAWHDLAAAKQALQSAESVKSARPVVETQLLISALSSLIGVESNISELNVKLNNSGAQNTRLEGEIAQLKAEQEVLNNALEKLKKLSIGN